MKTAVKDRREMMTNQLLLRGYATMKEILTASFGEWPPRGLEMNPAITHEQRVAIRPILDSLKGEQEGGVFSRLKEMVGVLVDTGGCTFPGGAREIFLNKLACRLLGSNDTISILSHEATHILQLDHSYRAREVFGRDASLEILKLQRARPASDALMTSLGKDFNKAADKKLAYLGRGMEVQARIHEIMIDAYQRSGRLPLKMDELWMALQSAGLRPPPSITRQLKSVSTHPDVWVFRSDKPSLAANMRAKDIQKVNDSLTPEGQEVFWRETLPGMYADLIEMYGDTRGRERFFPSQKNPKRDFAQLPDVGF